MKKYNGWSLDEKDIAGRTKYIVILNGDLDINNAYGFKSKTDLKAFFFDARSAYGRNHVQAIFKVEAIEI